MGDLFAGLEGCGLNLSNMSIYDENSNSKDGKENGSAKTVVTEADVIFDKTHKCPLCDKEFKTKAVKTGKVKLLGTDTDLRPKYQIADSLKYDAIVCPNCGYSALTRFFEHLSSAQAKLVKDSISNKFKGIEESKDIYTYDCAIERHKLALVNAIVKKGKNSERAYICLKIAWLLRGKAEELQSLFSKNFPSETVDNVQEYRKSRQELDKNLAELASQENEFIRNSYEGFTSAFSKELFPMCGMDEITTTYLVGDLARRCGKFDEAGRWISKVLLSRDANERIKAKAREIKELIKERA